jgi:hypothetical protein
MDAQAARRMSMPEASIDDTTNSSQVDLVRAVCTAVCHLHAIH